MSDPLDRLSGLAPRVDHARARAYFDRHRSRARLRRRIAAGAAVVAVVVAGSVAALAGNGTNDSTSVSTADATEPDEATDPVRSPPTVVVLSEGTGTAQYMVANALLDCGFDVMVEAADHPAIADPISVTSTEPYRTLATTAATIVGTTEVMTISDATRRGGDIVVTVGDDYNPDSIDTTPCPVDSVFEPGGPPTPGTPPLLSIDVTRVEGPDATAAIYGTHTIDPDTPVGMCVSFSIGGMSCGGDTDPLPGLVGGIYGGEADLVAFVGPPSAARIEVQGDNGTWSTSAHPIPSSIDIDGTVAVLDLSNASRITEVRALDADGNVIARNNSQQTLGHVNRSLDHRTGPVDPTAKQTDAENAETIVRSFLRFAEEPSVSTAESLPLADTVRLGLASELHQDRSRSQLADPAAWVIDEEYFRAYTGPFSALDVAAGAQNPIVSVGEHPHCASPPVPPPADVADLMRVSVQPDIEQIDSCLQWWTVDFFINQAGQIEAVTVDLWEP